MASVILQRGRKKAGIGTSVDFRQRSGNGGGKSRRRWAGGRPQPSKKIFGNRILQSGIADPDQSRVAQAACGNGYGLFAERFARCLNHRERFLGGENAYRLVYGEADFLPGLIVDRFGDVLVVQLLTLGMDKRRAEIVEALVQVLEPKGIYERSDVGVRELEGLEQKTGVLYGECPRHVTVTENGLKLIVDIEQGQKTGYFFDQRENRASIAPLMTGWGHAAALHCKRLRVRTA